MKKSALTMLAALALGIMMTLSTAVALAGWDYEDCPPASEAGKANMSDNAAAIVHNVNPPANDHAWNAPSK